MLSHCPEWPLDGVPALPSPFVLKASFHQAQEK
jgi:hypothetical protein